MENEKTPKAFVSPAHRDVYAIGAIGAFTKYDFRIGFYNSVTPIKDKKGKIEPAYQVDTTIIMPAQPLKDLAVWTMVRYLNYEEEHGDIPFGENSLRNLINVLEKINKYDIEELKAKLAVIEKEKAPTTKAKKG